MSVLDEMTDANVETMEAELLAIPRELRELDQHDVEEIRELMSEAARFLSTPLAWWQMGKAHNRYRKDLIVQLNTKSIDLRLKI